MKKFIATENAPKAAGPYTQAIAANNFVFLSGQIALDPRTSTLKGKSIEEQTEQVISNLTAVLREAGASIEDVVQSHCFLTNMDEYTKFNEVYGKYFGTSKPARFTVEVSRLPLGAKVEIAVVAQINKA